MFHRVAIDGVLAHMFLCDVVNLNRDKDTSSSSLTFWYLFLPKNKILSS